MGWNCMSKALRFLQITAEHQDCPFFTVFLSNRKILSQNISITLLQISLKLHEYRGGYWRKKLPWMILEEQFPVPRYTAVSKIGNSVIATLIMTNFHLHLIQLWWQFFQNFVYGDVVYAQTWKVLVLENYIEPPWSDTACANFLYVITECYNAFSRWVPFSNLMRGTLTCVFLIGL